MQIMLNSQTYGSEAQKRANDAVLRGVDQQQTALQNDARQLVHLQQQAQGATGQMAAIQYANQLASAQTNQLLQIRGLLVAQQNADVTRSAVITDREAQQAAASLHLRRGSFKKSPLEAGEDNTMIIKIGFAVAVLVLSGCDNSKNNQSCSDVRHMEDSPNVGS